MNIIYHMQRLNNILTGLTRFTMSIAVAAMAMLIMLSVIVRNLLGFSFQWIVDVNRLIFIWMCFIGLVYVSDKELLIRFDIIEKHFSSSLHKAVMIVRYTVSLVLFGIMVQAGFGVSQFAKAQVFSTIPVSTSWLYLSVVVAGILLVFQTVVKILVTLFPSVSE